MEQELIASLDSPRLGARTNRLLAVCVLSLASLWLVFPDGHLAIQLDPSPAALGQVASADATDHVVLAAFSDAPLTLADIQTLATVESRVRAIDGVIGIHSIASAELPQTHGDDIEVDSLRNRLRRASTPEQRDALLNDAFHEPLVLGRLVSTDLKAAAIDIELSGTDAEKENAIPRVRQITAEFGGPTLHWAQSGRPVVNRAIVGLVQSQMSYVLPAATGLFALVIWLAFRSAAAALGALLCIGIALLWTLAFGQLLGWPLNLITIMIPPLVMTFTVSYCIHVISVRAAYSDLNQGLRSIRSALAFSALTTAVGLAALALNDFQAIRQFAVLGTVGTIAAVLTAWLLMPLILDVAGPPSPLLPAIEKRLDRLASRVSAFVARHNGRIVQGGFLALALFAVGSALVRPGATYIDDLPATLDARTDFEKISAAFGGVSRFHVRITGAAEDVMIAPNVLQAIDEFEQWLHQQPEVGGTISPIGYIKRLNQAFGSGAPEDYRLPGNLSLTKQLLYAAAPQDLYRYTDPVFTWMQIDVRTAVNDTTALSDLFERTRARLADLPPGLEFRVGGDSAELTEMMETLAGGQLRSLGGAALVILALLTVVFGSPKVGAMTMLPNALPVVAYFAVLGFTGMPLTPTMALVACIVLGIAVDDTLHFLVRFNQRARELANEADASRATIAEVLTPVSLTTVATCCGFLTLLGSPFHSQMQFGVLAAMTLLLAWLSDLLLTPAVCARSSIVTLWDRLRLDLGGDPQHTIPMLHDMSERQARQFALNTQIRLVPAGVDLIRQDEEGHEMYIVLDGRLRVWMRGAEARTQELTQLTRGATLGEVGHFAHRRSASATAEIDTRVLVLDAAILERLRRRYPRIAALAYRNLNRIQAERTVREQRLTHATSPNAS